MNQNFDVKTASLKDFDSNGIFDLEDRASLFSEYLNWRNTLKHNTYRVDSLTGSGATMEVIDPYSGNTKNVISFVSNDYLGFSHHPKIVETSINAIKQYGVGAGALDMFVHASVVDGCCNIKEQLQNLHINCGKTESAIFPIMICDEPKTNEAAKILFENGIYVNPITYPAVTRKQSRLRMSVLATHSKEDLDTALNLLEYVIQKLYIKKC